MSRSDKPTLRRAAAEAARGLAGPALLFGASANLLLFAGPLYLLQVHDRVLATRSLPTLLVLTGLVIGLTLALGVLEFARHRLMTLLGARLQASLDPRVFRASLRRASQHPHDPLAASAPQDLDVLRSFAASPLLLALADLPWVPLFVAALFLLHPWLGLAALLGAMVLVALGLVTRAWVGPDLEEAARVTAEAERHTATARAEAGTLHALGMVPAMLATWCAIRAASRDDTVAARVSVLASAVRTLRLLLQALTIALGAILVLRDELSAGAMVAAALLAARALAPIDTAVAHWPMADRARLAWRRLATLLDDTGVPETPGLALPRPQGRLDVAGLTVTPPGADAPALVDVGFRLAPGEALGVIGASGSGKSTLARVLAGHWPAPSGTVRLDGASLDHHAPQALGDAIGYLPQNATLFDGTVAGNIARLDPAADPGRIIAAARAAGAHEMILRLPRGYDTTLATPGWPLSGGQARRIALARALYGDPALLILDEPEAHLDAEGAAALGHMLAVLKAQGRAILVTSHRPLAIGALDRLLVLEAGRVALQGPRDAVLRHLLATAPRPIRAEGAA